MFGQLLLYLFSFVGIWTGAGLALSSVEKLSARLKLSSFAVSFLVLGLFTSLSEMSVGMNSLIDNDPAIFVGNLIGASIVLLLLVIPVLIISGSDIKINPELRGFNLALTLVTISLPVILALDGRIDRTDGIITISTYLLLVMAIQTKRGVLEKLTHIGLTQKANVRRELLQVIIGVFVIFVSSKFAVAQTIFFSTALGLPEFLISLLIISLGTNVPELSFVVRSKFKKDKQVAFGDYLGSASFNTILFGGLTLMYGKPIILENSYLISLVFLIVGLITFFSFARSKNTLTRKEGMWLLILYVLFVATEVVLNPDILNAF